MTLLLAWVGKDSRKISSFYIASDSRISWGKPTKFDYGRKVFAFKNSPDILGYCGDVLYPSVILNQILEMDNDQILFKEGTTNQQRSNILFDLLQDKFQNYPSESVMRDSLEIIHVSRDNELDFICNIFSWNKINGWKCTSQEIPDGSEKVIALGTGADEYYQRYLKYYAGFSGKTSRALFQSLTHSLLKMKNLECGGAPQLVGLFNKFNGKNFGVIFEGKSYYLGKEVEPSAELNKIEWRNELFERCDGLSTKILDGAQKQPDELRP